MNTKINRIHHVGHVVKDMNIALELYRKVGFECPPPAYPTMAEKEGEAPKPFGAGNTHANFLRNFVEIVTVVEAGGQIPEDAKLIPLQAPPAVLPRILESVRRTVKTVSDCLARHEGTHILCFHTSDIKASAARLDSEQVGHSGVNTLQRPVDTMAGLKVVPVHFLEIDGEYAPEGRLAIAENPPEEILKMQSHLEHPNGALELVEIILCVADNELNNFVKRYVRYLGCQAQIQGSARVFSLEDARITIVPESGLSAMLPGEKVHSLPGFAGYAVTVRDLSAAKKYIGENGLPIVETPAGDFFIPAAEALGTAIILRQV